MSCALNPSPSMALGLGLSLGGHATAASAASSSCQRAAIAPAIPTQQSQRQGMCASVLSVTVLVLCVTGLQVSSPVLRPLFVSAIGHQMPHNVASRLHEAEAGGCRFPTQPGAQSETGGEELTMRRPGSCPPLSGSHADSRTGWTAGRVGTGGPQASAPAPPAPGRGFAQPD